MVAPRLLYLHLPVYFFPSIKSLRIFNTVLSNEILKNFEQQGLFPKSPALERHTELKDGDYKLTNTYFSPQHNRVTSQSNHKIDTGGLNFKL